MMNGPAGDTESARDLSGSDRKGVEGEALMKDAGVLASVSDVDGVMACGIRVTEATALPLPLFFERTYDQP